jgi:hypothetical protein
MEISDTGKQLLLSLKETRKFFEQVSLLMRTVEDELAGKGWGNGLKNFSKRSSDISSDLYQPQKWMPRMVSRLFVNEENKNIVLYVGVYFDVETDWEGFDQPWLTCGLLKFAPNQNTMDNPSIGWIDVHLVDEHPADGEFYRFTWEQDQIPDDGEFYRSSMARPLIEFQNANDITTKIVIPLMEELKYASNSIKWIE